MDIDMDIDFDDRPAQQPVQPSAQVPAQTNNEGDTEMPAAYYESLDAPAVQAWPETLNLQGVRSFDPNDPTYYAIEHLGTAPRTKQLRWVHDDSVNIEFYNAEDAALALQGLTDPSAGDPTSLDPQTSRLARPYSKQPGDTLMLRQANSGDQKAKYAAKHSTYYRHNPAVRGNRGREPRPREPRRRPPPDYLDYDGVDTRERLRRSASGDEPMNGRRSANRDTRPRQRGGDVDSYRPGSRSPRESRFGRLRGRSASPVSGDEGDGRLGFTEHGTSMRSRYRSRSRDRTNRRREPSEERWVHDRAGFTDQRPRSSGGRWVKDASITRYADAFTSSTKAHRRSDATDETANTRKGSLLDRMTKDGKPIIAPSRSLASRITRDDDDEEPSYGRLKNDYSAPRNYEFDEPTPSRGLASRITRDDDEIQIRGQSRDTEGINIRGTAKQGGGFSIRGVANGA